jgi:hypothetical protein
LTNSNVVLYDPGTSYRESRISMRQALLRQQTSVVSTGAHPVGAFAPHAARSEE